MRPLGTWIESKFDHDPNNVVAYRGYGTAERVLVLGRALQDEGLRVPDVAASRWRNFKEALKRIESDPIQGARVRARVADTEHELTADDEGYVRHWLTLPQPLAAGWHPLSLSLDSAATPSAPSTGSASEILLPPASAEYGVISDMDDTVLQSEVTKLLRAARLMLLENAKTRLPFPGVAAFYRALALGVGDAARDNPIFYVSNSPWNLYGVIADFLTGQELPAGPILLTDWDFGRPPRDHKVTAIGEILATYPNLPFLLVGDSGQEDPEIYSDLVRRYPGRILAVYIRNVVRHPERIAAIQTLAAEVTSAGSALVLADDTLAAARHAAEKGWIRSEALGEIGTDKRDDEGKTDEKAAAPGVEPAVPAPTVVVESSAG